jgi:hypothetical protein
MATPPPDQQPTQPWGQPQQPGWGQPQPPGWGQPTQPPAKPKRGKSGCLGCAGILVLAAIIGIGANTAGNHTKTTATTPAASSAPAGQAQNQPPATSSAPAAAPTPAVQHTVTFVVTGAADADVNYGQAGSTIQGHAPMSVSQPLGNPLYYSISAQLQGDGQVSCEIQIDGKAISQATASGGYNIAMCEISKDLFNGQWKDANKIAG